VDIVGLQSRLRMSLSSTMMLCVIACLGASNHPIHEAILLVPKLAANRRPVDPIGK